MTEETVYVTPLNSRGSLPYSYHTSKECAHGPDEPQPEDLETLEADERYELCTFCRDGYTGPKDQSHKYQRIARAVDAEEVFND